MNVAHCRVDLFMIHGQRSRQDAKNIDFTFVSQLVENSISNLSIFHQNYSFSRIIFKNMKDFL